MTCRILMQRRRERVEIYVPMTLQMEECEKKREKEKRLQTSTTKEQPVWKITSPESTIKNSYGPAVLKIWVQDVPNANSSN